jgi:hypothetical protein
MAITAGNNGFFTLDDGLSALNAQNELVKFLVR